MLEDFAVPLKTSINCFSINHSASSTFEKSIFSHPQESEPEDVCRAEVQSNK